MLLSKENEHVFRGHFYYGRQQSLAVKSRPFKITSLPQKKVNMILLTEKKEAITLNDSIPRSRPGYHLGYTERTRSGDPCLHN